MAKGTKAQFYFRSSSLRAGRYLLPLELVQLLPCHRYTLQATTCHALCLMMVHLSRAATWANLGLLCVKTVLLETGGRLLWPVRGPLVHSSSQSVVPSRAEPSACQSLAYRISWCKMVSGVGNLVLLASFDQTYVASSTKRCWALWGCCALFQRIASWGKGGPTTQGMGLPFASHYVVVVRRRAGCQVGLQAGGRRQGRGSKWAWLPPCCWLPVGHNLYLDGSRWWLAQGTIAVQYLQTRHFTC